MGCALTSRQHQNDFKKTIVKIFFLFHLGNSLLIINVTQCTFPLIVEFDAVRSFLAETLHPNFNSKDTPFICVPSRDPQGSLVSVQSGQKWGGTMDIKDTLPPFYENPKGWTGPQGTGKTLISKIQNNQKSFNRLQSKLQLFQTHPSPTCKDKQCNPLRLVMENPWSMT
jgi:hypothetical protein